METIKIGTRGSKLALWQAEYIADLLKVGGLNTEIVKIETKGDKILDVSISKIGSKGVFTEEIEEQLANGSIDIAVHSAKDLQSELDKGFSIIAFTEREKVNDVLIGSKEIDLSDTSKQIVIGTSSTRRVATFRHFYPNVITKEVRGNLQTRIRKLEEGNYDALMLAYAGVKRMNYQDMIRETLSLDEFIPAVGQGSVAIEIHENMSGEKVNKLRSLLNHPPTEMCLLAERGYLKKLQGGCSIPVFALATLLDSGELSITGGIVSLDGKDRIIHTETGVPEDAESIGMNLGEKVLNSGGDKILQTIKNQIGS